MSGVVVSISGPPNSGKTTLWQALREYLGSGDTEWLPDYPRLAFDAVSPDLLQRDLEAFQHYIGYRQLIQEEEAQRGPANIAFCDKSLVDATGYWDVLVRTPRPVWADARIGRYSLVILCDPADVRTPPDGLSRMHAQERMALDEAIGAAAVDSGDHIVRVSGPLVVRLRTALSALRAQLDGAPTGRTVGMPTDGGLGKAAESQAIQSGARAPAALRTEGCRPSAPG